MRRIHYCCLVIFAGWLTLSVWSARLASAEETAKPAPPKKPATKSAPAEAEKYIRIRRDDKGEPLAMETALIRYVDAAGKRPDLLVDLIGAVHVGDRSYYQDLNKRFESYEALLYELVAPEGTRVPKGARMGSGHPVGAMQNGMKSMLGLEHQLELIDYSKPNFIHADMSPKEFDQRMTERGESWGGMFLRAMGHGMAQQGTQNAPDEFGMLLALFSKDRARKMKLAMAQQFENLEGQMAPFEGPEGSTIITERNKKAFEVLRKQIDLGKKKIGVFYGAGHLPDMDKRLLADFGLKRQSLDWVPAWSLVAAPAKKPAAKKPEPPRPEPEEAGK